MSTFYAGDSRAKMCHSPDSPKGSTAHEADSGASTCESFAWFDHDTSSWKTSQPSLFGGWTAFSETLPESGTMRNGRLYRRAPWVPHMCDDDCSLWPTPTASMGKRGFGLTLDPDCDRYRPSTIARAQALVHAHGWKIHPHFTEALMGFPLGWTEIEPSEMPSCPPSGK